MILLVELRVLRSLMGSFGLCWHRLKELFSRFFSFFCCRVGET